MLNRYMTGRMARGRPKAELVLTASEREQPTAQALALRSRIVLACSSGAENQAVAEEPSVTKADSLQMRDAGGRIRATATMQLILNTQ
jgi:hypothetical protein